MSNLKQYSQPEFEDYLKILEFGAKKYGNGNWLQTDGTKANWKDMHFSMCRHLGQSLACPPTPDQKISVSEACCQIRAGVAKAFQYKRLDQDTDLDALLHLICRAQMVYTKTLRGLYE